MSPKKQSKKRPAANKSEGDASAAEVFLVRQHDIDVPKVLPLIGIENSVIFPFMIAPVVLSPDHDKSLIDDVLRGDRLLGAFLKKKPSYLLAQPALGDCGHNHHPEHH